MGTTTIKLSSISKQQQQQQQKQQKQQQQQRSKSQQEQLTFAKASLVGATTVKGPSPARVSVSPAASMKSTSCVAPWKRFG